MCPAAFKCQLTTYSVGPVSRPAHFRPISPTPFLSILSSWPPQELSSSLEASLPCATLSRCYNNIINVANYLMRF